MTPRGPRRRLRVALMVGVLVLLSPPPAASAEVEGPCSASFNGVEVQRIDTLSSPLELTIDDQLTFHGDDPAGTQQAAVELILASVGIDQGASSYGPAQNEFSASLDLEDVAPYGVGLFRVRGTTDNCTAQAWVRIGGKVPVTTLTGITGLGLALGGLTGQLAAVAARRRRAWLTAGIAGVATGLGAALLGQQFGRLQLSYISIAVVVGAAVALGALVGWLVQLRSRPSETRREVPRREARDETQRARDDARQLRDEQLAREAAAREQRETAVHDRQVSPATRMAKPAAGATAPVETGPASAARPEGPYWCYVMSHVEVLDLAQPTRVIAVLKPGTWYLARREAGEWVHVVAADDLEGWAPRASVHRHG